MTPTPAHRPIRSFVRREGRMTETQRHALRVLWPRFGLEPGPTDQTSTEPLDLESIFGRRAPRTLEIGFGDGEALLTLAQHYPENDYLGIEVYRPGVGHLLLRLEQLGLTNVRIICADAFEIVHKHLANNSLDCVQIFFPDPWPKKRHHKRRLIQPDFVALLASRLKPGGRLHLATDWENYAEYMLELLHASPEFGAAVTGPAQRPETKFERRGKHQGHTIWDLRFQRR